MQNSALLTLCLAAMLLTGCTGAFEPFQRPGNWSMTGAARENTAQQVANPSDLFNGQSATNSNGVAASAAVDKALGGSTGNAAGLEATPQPIVQTGS